MKQKLWSIISIFIFVFLYADSEKVPNRALRIQSIIGNFTLAGSETVEGNNNVYGNKTINGGLTVNGNETIRNNIIVLGRLLTQASNPPSFSGGLTLTGSPQQACIIFQDSSSNEKTRICSSSTPGAHGIFVSLDGGATQTLQVANGGNVVLNPASSTQTLTVNSNTTVGALSAVGSSTAIAPALQLSTNNPPASVNDAVLRVNSSGAVTQGLPGYVVTNTANFTTYFPAYAPLTSAMASGSTVTYFGDSITIGNGVTAAQRWATLVSNYFNVIESNQGVSGNWTNDLVSTSGTSGSQSIYNQRPSGVNRTTFIALGINDFDNNATYTGTIDEIRRTMESSILFCCLPSSQIVNARSIPVGPNRTGTWTNSPFFSWGLQTTDNATPASLTATVTGRFVCFSAPTQAPSPTEWNVAVDNVSIGTAQMAKNDATTQNGSIYGNALWVYDTQSAPTASHTITITRNATSATTGFITWFGGFNINNANTNTIFIISVTEPYFQRRAFGTESKRFSWLQALEDMCRRFRTQYGFPVYYIDVSIPWVWGMLQADALHPNPSGHQYMANRIITAINNGEFNYLLVDDTEI